MAHTHKHEYKIWETGPERDKAIAKSKISLKTADEEFEAAFKILKKYPKRITFFGAARMSPRRKAYQQARELASKLADDGFAVLSGGGGGIMEASNRGAADSQKVSIGFNIVLPHEQKLNDYTTDNLQFNYFFTRKVMMSFYAHAFVIFPGGFGTFDEFFEVLTLIQTGKMPRVPVILVGKKFWKPVDRFIKNHMIKGGMVADQDRRIYTITDDLRYIRKIINTDYDS